ncbi:MAG: hypothetical protein FWC77_07795 [Defluviitaleaceae bacterium]|nr:hypothetical protein [Defluviitaleaceae bacterium]
MFCEICGSEVAEGTVCQCGFDTSNPAPQYDQGNTANEFINTVTARFSINQIAILGGCFFLFIFLFLPFITVSIGMHNRISTSGFSMVFGDAGSFGGFLNYLLPILVVAGLSFAKFSESKLLVLVFAFLGMYINLAMLLGSRTPMTSAGIGLIFSFLMWIGVTAAAFMEYKGINALNDFVGNLLKR